MTERSGLPDQLPDEWEWSTFGDVADYINGYGFSKAEWDDKGRPIIRIQNLTGTGDSFNYHYGEIDEKYIVPNGTLLISWSATLGAYIWRGEEGVLNQHIYKVEPYDNILKKYLYYIADFSADELMRRAHGSGMKHVTKGVFDSFPIRLPPVSEQRRIVSKIEELFSNLDAGLDSLQTAKRQLERYRLSVLQAAVEGRLTAEWRRTHSPEPADRLIRRATEHDEINKYKKRGKMATLPDQLPFDLPDGWQWTRVGDVARRIRYGTSDKAEKENQGIAVLRMGDIVDGKLRYDDLKFMPHDWDDEEKFLLEDGDLLFNRTNSAELVGKTAVYKKDHPPAVFASYLVRARLYEGICEPEFLAHYINSAYGRAYISRVTSQQVGQANVNATKLASMPFPLPPIVEQREIVGSVDRLLSIADNVASTSASEEMRGSRLRQSILKKAFAGRLTSAPDHQHTIL